MRILLAILYLTIFSYAAFNLDLKPFGVALLMLPIAAAALITFLAARKFIETTLVGFATLFALYMVLSYMGWLHRDITLVFERSAILQQAAYGIFLPILIPAFASYHLGILRRDIFYLRMERAVFVLCIAGHVSYFVQNDVSQLVQIGTLTNYELIAMFIFVRWVLSSRRISNLLSFGLIVGLLLLAGSIQAKIVIAMLLIFMIARPLQPYTLSVYVAVAVIAPILAPIYAETLWRLDPNTGIRAFFWRDVIDRLIESHGIGVGFGTETVRPVYEVLGNDIMFDTPQQEKFIHIGSHSAIYDVIYRVGFLGIAMLMFYLSRIFYRIVRFGRQFTTFDYWVFTVVILDLGANVALVSVNFVFGTTFALAWFVARQKVDMGRRNLGRHSVGRTAEAIGTVDPPH